MSSRKVTWQGHPHAPAPLGAIRAAQREGPVTIVDDAGRAVQLGAIRRCTESIRIAWQRLLQLDLSLVSSLLTSRKAPDHARAKAAAAAPLAVLRRARRWRDNTRIGHRL